MQHRGRAVVFENIEDYKAKIDDEALDVDETCMLVLKNCGPKGYPGMAEVGNMGLPPKVLRKGVRDMVRISDARMSGTAYGTVVLHVCPEAAAGGTLALVENGDMIELDVEARRLHLEVDEDELARRRERLAAAGAGDDLGLPEALRRHRAAGLRGRRPRLPARLPRRRDPAREPLRSPTRGIGAYGALRSAISIAAAFGGAAMLSFWCARSTKTWCSRLKQRAARAGRSAEAEHRLILERRCGRASRALPSARAATGRRCAAGCTATAPS